MAADDRDRSDEDWADGAAGPDVLPEGWRVVLDRSVSFVSDGTALLGGRPGRLMALTPAGRTALDALLVDGSGVPDRAARRLGRRLVDAGIAHPRPPATILGPGGITVTVAVPVRDRADELDGCLASLGRVHPVIVVDDGSDDPAAIADVCRRHGARMLARPTNGGAATARNVALAVVESDVVAFVDSDCRIVPAAIDALLPYFADPAIGAVAPRVRPRPVASDSSGTLVNRYATVRSALDMGADEGPVGPGCTIRYVPATALLVRRQAGGPGFDTRLRVGEDVDFVWRLGDRGWQVRYVPSVCAHHREPDGWLEHLGRRLRYGTSAGPLARRHPGRMNPVELRASPAAVTAALVTGRRRLAGVLWAAGCGLALRRLAGSKVPAVRVVGWQFAAPWWTVLGLARATSTVVVPGLCVFVVAGRRRRWAWAAVLLGLPGMVDWWQRRPAVDPIRWAAVCLADGLAYGAGVWVGCLRARTAAPLLPALHLPEPIKLIAAARRALGATGARRTRRRRGHGGHGAAAPTPSRRVASSERGRQGRRARRCQADEDSSEGCRSSDD
jgi:mycofactocin system glycosyltransferase